LVRIFAEWTGIIGDWSVPQWISWVAVIVAGGLARSYRVENQPAGIKTIQFYRLIVCP
jgi:hypothetical protein